MFDVIPLIIYAAASGILITYGLHHYFVIYLFLRSQGKINQANKEAEEEFSISDNNTAPAVLSQIPLYNESTVAERIIRSVAAIDYPNHIIQVLDDSDDETIQLVDKVVADLVAEGHNIEAVRREKRVGFKAGALDYGLGLCDAQYIAVFDSDFVVPKNFLKRTIPHFLAQEKCGVVQARWGHLNEGDSAFTKAQSMGVNAHFVVEQVARSYNDYFLNFNGTAGVWNREAIDAAGGWNDNTLTEDLDLSYRAQLKGWKFHFLPDLKVPAEIPPLYRGFRSQQFRWAKGSIQTAKLILPKVWGAAIPLRKKIEATFHLTHYAIHFCMFVQALFGLPILFISKQPFTPVAIAILTIPMILAMIGPSLLCLVAENWLDARLGIKKFISRLPMLLLVGFGICISNSRACVEGIIGIKSPFVRTPKQGNSKKQIRYKGKKSYMPYVELFMALYTLVTAILYFKAQLYGMSPFFLVYTIGFAMFGFRSLQEGKIKRAIPAQENELANQPS